MFQLIIRIASSEMKTAWLRRKGSVQAPPFLTPSLPPVQKFWMILQEETEVREGVPAHHSHRFQWNENLLASAKRQCVSFSLSHPFVGSCSTILDDLTEGNGGKEG
jgi:hypothetical protein